MAAMVENDTSLTLHLKGFGLRLDYSNPIVAKAAEDVVSFVVGLKPTTLVFGNLPPCTLLISFLRNIGTLHRTPL